MRGIGRLIARENDFMGGETVLIGCRNGLIAGEKDFNGAQTGRVDRENRVNAGENDLSNDANGRVGAENDRADAANGRADAANGRADGKNGRTGDETPLHCDVVILAEDLNPWGEVDEATKTNGGFTGETFRARDYPHDDHDSAQQQHNSR